MLEKGMSLLNVLESILGVLQSISSVHFGDGNLNPSARRVLTSNETVQKSKHGILAISNPCKIKYLKPCEATKSQFLGFFDSLN
jgi:hypothetical protein